MGSYNYESVFTAIITSTVVTLPRNLVYRSRDSKFPCEDSHNGELFCDLSSAWFQYFSKLLSTQFGRILCYGTDHL